MSKQPGTEREPETTVVVGVDGSEHNEAAVDYAAAEAAASGAQLRLVTVVDHNSPLIGEPVPVADHCLRMLEEVRTRIVRAAPDLTMDLRVRHGNPAAALLESAGDRDLLVVGRRGLGALKRLLIGSTSIRAAGRARVPAVVVPAGWHQPAGSARAVVVGVDPDHAHEATLRFAFERAARSGAPVRAVHGVDLDPALALGAAVTTVSDIRDWEIRSVAAIEAALKPFREEYPEVEVELVKERGRAADLILEHAEDAQLIVLGRRHHGPASWGLGSVAREVLHAAETPVAVVPVG